MFLRLTTFWFSLTVIAQSKGKNNLTLNQTLLKPAILTLMKHVSFFPLVKTILLANALQFVGIVFRQNFGWFSLQLVVRSCSSIAFRMPSPLNTSQDWIFWIYYWSNWGYLVTCTVYRWHKKSITCLRLPLKYSFLLFFYHETLPFNWARISLKSLRTSL